MIKTSELKAKEIINVSNGQRLGTIEDIDIDLVAGKINGIIVPKEEKFIKFFSENNDLYISWSNIEKIGEDVILVTVNDGLDSSPGED
ncbi:YlmC/YmxH family sporulation protein [Natroniella sulfidigena]|uniref:YlmC/YmxH family sporulation protein n=1 Tax=Natroniella sulfidigena TaxID=723921 RepID=UPI00200AA250|nr:YlmC/YmxH family sporulation protein [Natroniella sulfidigena]MCK8817387.1 YlmC/YmxH family sporulation protein [Natroniella sulfidigena]